MKAFRLFNRVKETGQSLVEVALALPLLLTIFAGTVEAGNLLIAQNRVSTATRAATSFGVTHLNADELPSDWASAMAQAAYNSVLGTPQQDEAMWNFAVVRARTGSDGSSFASWEQEDILGGEEDFLPEDEVLQNQVLQQLQANGHDASNLELLVTVTHAKYQSLIRLDSFFASYPETLSSINIGIVHRQDGEYDNDDPDGAGVTPTATPPGGTGGEPTPTPTAAQGKCITWMKHVETKDDYYDDYFLGAIDKDGNFVRIDFGAEESVTVDRIVGEADSWTYDAVYEWKGGNNGSDRWWLKYDGADLGEHDELETDEIVLVLNADRVNLNDPKVRYEMEVMSKAAQPNSGWRPLALAVGATTEVDSLGFQTTVMAIENVATEVGDGIAVTLHLSGVYPPHALSHVNFHVSRIECIEWIDPPPPDEEDGELDGRYSDFLATPTPAP